MTSRPKKTRAKRGTAALPPPVSIAQTRDVLRRMGMPVTPTTINLLLGLLEGLDLRLAKLEQEKR